MTATPETSPLPADVAAKVRDGHTFKNDSPGGLSSVSRWTCTTCGDAVLKYGSSIYDSNVYGGATERTCEESAAFWVKANSLPGGVQ